MLSPPPPPQWYILAQSQSIFHMHQAPIMVDYCIKYEPNQLHQIWTKSTIVFQDITTNTFMRNVVTISRITANQCLVPDYCTKYEHYHHILLVNITTNTQNVWKCCHTYSHLAQNQMKFYFTYTINPWYLIMAPNMKKIHPTIMEECTRKDRRLDLQTPGLFQYSPIPLLWSWE